jgi:hypothetical protein
MSENRIVLFPFGAELVVGELLPPTIEGEVQKLFTIKRPCTLKLFMGQSGPGGTMAGTWAAIPMPLRKLDFIEGEVLPFQDATELESIYREALAAAAGLSLRSRG